MTDELQTRIDAVREQARRVFWRRWLAQFMPIFFVVFVAGRLADPDDNESFLGTLVGTALGALVSGVLLFVAFKRGWLPEPPLTAGLPREQRRAVTRDLRRGQPSADPFLRQIENSYVARYRRTGLVIVWVGPLAAAAFAVFACYADTVAGRVLGIFASGAMLASAAYQVRLNRGMRAFG